MLLNQSSLSMLNAETPECKASMHLPLRLVLCLHVPKSKLCLFS